MPYLKKYLKKSLSESKFNMWRACMGIVHLDGHASAEELDWAKGKLELVPFSEEQVEILKNDLMDLEKLDQVVEKITDKKDLAFLLHMTRVIGHLDKNFCHIERAFFENLEKKILSNVDIAAITETVTQMEEESYLPEVRGNRSFIQYCIDCMAKYLFW